MFHSFSFQYTINCTTLKWNDFSILIQDIGLVQELEAKTRQVLPNIPNADLPGIVINGIHNEKMTQDAYNDLTGGKYF